MLKEIEAVFSKIPHCQEQGFDTAEKMLDSLKTVSGEETGDFLQAVKTQLNNNDDLYNRALKAVLGEEVSREPGTELRTVFDDLSIPKINAQPIDPENHNIKFQTPDGPLDVFNQSDAEVLPCATFHPTKIFPEEKNGANLENMAAKFIDDWKNVETSDPGKWIDRTLSMVLRYLWCVSASKDLETVSFFDRVKITLAVTCSLDLAEESTPTEMLLTAGDISGIQNYLFDISDPGGKRIAQRLRARSFYLSKITDLYLYRLREEYNLPSANIIFNGGGRFIMLLPYTESISDYLRKSQIAVNLDMLRQTIGDLSFNLGVKPTEPDELSLGKFPETLGVLNALVERQKNRRFSDLLRSESGWNTEHFVVTEDIYQKYKNGVCVSCGKLPVEKENTELCASCHKDNVNGKRILDTESLDYDFGEGDIYLFSEKEDRVSVRLQQEKDPDSIIINPDEEQKIANYDGFVYLNNYVPLRDDNSEGKKAIPTDDLPKIGHARHHADPDAQAPHPYLGYFKADVDRLGTLFSSGFQNGGGLIGFSTLSRLMDTFFGGYTRELQLSGLIRFGDYEVDLSKIYTVFAGGDDLMFIGAWDSVIIFGYLLYLEFRRFASFNENVTFSAGVEVTGTNTPVSAASELAEEQLEKSKNSGRNRITALGSTFSWEEFTQLFHYAQFFDRELKRNNRNERGATINNYMISKLSQYAEQAKQFYSGQDPTAIIFVSRLMRDINRSIAQTDYRGNVQNKEVVEPIQYLLENRELIQKLSFPLRWAFLQNKSNSQ